MLHDTNVFLSSFSNYLFFLLSLLLKRRFIRDQDAGDIDTFEKLFTEMYINNIN